MSYMNINIQAFAPGTYTFSWSRQKTPSQLVKELCKKKKTAIDICSPVLRRSKPIPIPKKTEEKIEDSPITINHCIKNDSIFDFFR